MQSWLRVALAIVAIGAVVWVIRLPEPARPDAFAVYHYDSANVPPPSPESGGTFREVFVVHDVRRAVPLAGLRIVEKDALGHIPAGEEAGLEVVWQDNDGVVSVGDAFSFERLAFDEKLELVALSDGQEVMHCKYGAGGGHRLSLGEMKAAGETPHCLTNWGD